MEKIQGFTAVFLSDRVKLRRGCFYLPDCEKLFQDIIVTHKLNELFYMRFQNPVFTVDNIKTPFMCGFAKRKDQNLFGFLQICNGTHFPKLLSQHVFPCCNS